MLFGNASILALHQGASAIMRCKKAQPSNAALNSSGEPLEGVSDECASNGRDGLREAISRGNEKGIIPTSGTASKGHVASIPAHRPKKDS